jgi:hypothetical protein
MVNGGRKPWGNAMSASSLAGYVLFTIFTIVRLLFLVAVIGGVAAAIYGVVGPRPAAREARPTGAVAGRPEDRD